MKRPLFVFAGQSNMMGAAVRPASEQVYYKNSFEYLHNPRRLGADRGEFKTYGFPTGEFVYKDMVKAYGENYKPGMKSTLNNYSDNSYFNPSMNDIKDEETKERYSFYHFSESNLRMSVSPAPLMVKGLEDAGYACAYTHIARGGVSINYYLSGTAEERFYEKIADFFKDSEERFAGDDMSERVLFWHQGESDREMDHDTYVARLETFWERAKKAGFTKFCMIRVGFWGDENIAEVMRAQETFCAKTEDAYMVTRAASFLEWAPENPEGWICGELDDEFKMGRDSFYGFDNQHINEKGFKTIAKYAVPNIIRIVYEGSEPILEDEKINALK